MAAIASPVWDLVLGPNFSMFGNQPRAEHLLNFRRNLLLASEMAALGISAVPNLSQADGVGAVELEGGRWLVARRPVLCVHVEGGVRQFGPRQRGWRHRKASSHPGVTPATG